MACEQTRDVLRRVRAFHHQLAELYQQMSDAADVPRMKLLLDYMSQHEAGLEACLEGYERLADRRVLDTWFQYPPDWMPKLPCVDFELKPGMSLGEVVSTALAFDNCLLAYYERLIQEAPSEELSDLFQEMLVRGRREAVELSRSALEVELL